jgi:cytochrome c oxidase subunit 2
MKGVSTPSIFDPASTPAAMIVDYTTLVLGVCGVIFAIVMTLIIYSVVRFRARPGDDGREPAQVYGGTRVELAWTIIPVIIVVVLGMATARTILALQKTEAPEGALVVTAIGHQWWWEFYYPQYGFTTANELHIPLSNPTGSRPTFFNLQSQDVIHSFWVPQLSGKIDLIPNRENHLWVDPSEPGVYVGQCAEYCGTQHANMLLRVVVQPEAEFEAWASAQQRPAAERASAREGREIFERTACINCHTVRGTPAVGRFGPDLTHLMSRQTIGAGVAENDRRHLRDWIKHPDPMKPGVRMPAMQLEDEQIERVVDYLVTLE